MTIFRQRDIVVVPYPYVELSVTRGRPALVVSSRPLGGGNSLIWVLMITNAAHDGWPGDVAIPDHRKVGLPVASIIRTSKIATVEAESAKLIGSLGDVAWRNVVSELSQTLHLA